MAIAPFSAIDVLRRSELCRGLTAGEVGHIADIVQQVTFRSGEEIYRQGEDGNSMFIVARGRVKAMLGRSDGSSRLLDYLGTGEHFGDMDVLTGGHRACTVSAMMDTSLLELQRERFLKLIVSVPRFAANLTRSLGFQLRWATSGQTRRNRPAVVAIVSSTLRTQGLIRPLASSLVEHGERVEVMTDRTETWGAQGAYLIERIPAPEGDGDRAGLIHQRLVQVLDHQDRVLLDLTQKGLDSDLPEILAQCEEIWWCVDPQFVQGARRNLLTLLRVDPTLAPRIRIVWVLRESQRFPPRSLGDVGLAHRDFKVILAEDPTRGSLEQIKSIGRLSRHLRGTSVGLALGGGAARGMAHLGVLSVLEREGIFIDLMTGTSIGALIGASYAAGWSPEEALERFARELAPHWLLRKLPKGPSWYMWGMFFFNAWEAKLRRYMGDACLEQFRIPLSTVAVDLITGRQVIRSSGDAVSAILESINLPVIARPILRDGMVLVDGGILNNLPADLLPAQGADLVIGVDVVSKLPHKFAGNTPLTETQHMKKPGPLEVLMRVNEVQDYNINALRTGVIDLMIAPDTSAFEFADFGRGRELAERGERAAEEALPELKQMLADLDESAKPLRRAQRRVC